VVSEIGSTAKAAQCLGLSQPAISKAIAEMEHALGAPLLERSATGVELTPCGGMLVDRARVIFDEVRQGVKNIAHAFDPSRGNHLQCDHWRYDNAHARTSRA
jgi:DNA-binding transcriptional LysR family regulator